MASRQLTIDWLNQNINRYQHSQRVYTDVLAALDRYPSLRPKTDVYTFDDGRTQLLLCIHGLLPITFRNASYNIPIAIWLVLSYPADPPIVYVVPTSDMLVKPSAQIDHSGKCGIDYITNWHRKPEACSLAILLESMQSHFSNEPPLYAKSRSKPADKTSHAASPAVSSPGAPRAAASSSDHDHVTRAGESSPPRLPPKPFSSSPSTITAGGVAPSTPSEPLGPPSSASLSQTPTPSYPHYPGATGTDIRDRRPPPVPPHPGGPSLVSSAITSMAPAPGAASQVPVPNQNALGPPPYASSSPPVPPRPPLPPSPFAHQKALSSPPVADGQVGLDNVALRAVGPRAYTQPPPLPPHHGASEPGPGGALQSVQNSNLPGYQFNPAPPGMQPSEPRLSPPDLLDGDDDLAASLPSSTTITRTAPPPPRPPNPQTVALHNALLSSFRDALSRFTTTHTDTLARQRSAQTELFAGPEAIRDESARLQAVRDVCQVVGDRWETLIADGERQLGEMRRSGEVSVDEIVCASSIVGNQLVNLVAEDNAIEDSIYHLHRALNSGRIDLERFLRTTRVLAEEQFMKRALVEKILRGMPMGMAIR